MNLVPVPSPADDPYGVEAFEARLDTVEAVLQECLQRLRHHVEQVLDDEVFIIGARASLQYDDDDWPEAA